MRVEVPQNLINLTTTEQVVETHTRDGKFAPNNNANPTGKGGFRDNPHNRNRGGRPKNTERISWWYQYFLNMTPKEYAVWDSKGMPMAAVIAYEAFKHIDDLAVRKEITNRTEGTAKRFVRHESHTSLEYIAKRLQDIYEMSHE